MTAAYLAGVLRRTTAVLEWNDSGSFASLREVLSKNAVTNGDGKTFNMLGVYFCEKAGAKEMVQCAGQGMESIIVDFGCYREEIREEFLRCDRSFLVCSASDWQLAPLAKLLTEERDAGRKREYFASFGTEEALRTAERYLGVRIRRIPWFPDAFLVNGERMAFFEKIL